MNTGIMSLLPAQQQTMTTENTFAPAQALAMQQANIFSIDMLKHKRQ